MSVHDGHTRSVDVSDCVFLDPQPYEVMARDVVENIKIRMTGKRNGSNGHNGHNGDQFGRLKMDSLTAAYEEVEAEIEPRMLEAQLEEVDETRLEFVSHLDLPTFYNLEVMVKEGYTISRPCCESK